MAQKKTKKAQKFDAVKDSGARQDFGTGSVRDTQDGKGRNDLLPMLALLRLSQHFENGARKYGCRNWEKGQPLSRYWDSAFRHMTKVMLGLEDEDHMAAACWNMFCMLETKIRIDLGILSEELDDLPKDFQNSEVVEQILAMFGEKV